MGLAMYPSPLLPRCELRRLRSAGLGQSDIAGTLDGDAALR
jgi:hypothetical protein